MTIVELNTYPTSFAPDFRTLVPGAGLGEQADAAILSLAEHGFVASVGVHQRQLGALSVMAHQEHIVEYCPNDPSRFRGAKETQAWLKKSRVMVGIYASKWPEPFQLDNLPDVPERGLIQVAYGWFGPEQNKHIPEADITTAYRVGEGGRRLSRERRFDEADKFKLGLPLGELVVAVATAQYGLPVEKISLETWESNGANELYDQLGFVQPDDVEPQPDVRPTLKEVGNEINGNIVYHDLEKGKNMVADRRLFKALVRAA